MAVVKKDVLKLLKIHEKYLLLNQHNIIWGYRKLKKNEDNGIKSAKHFFFTT